MMQALNRPGAPTAFPPAVNPNYLQVTSAEESVHPLLQTVPHFLL
jgi:hypothetical protein